MHKPAVTDGNGLVSDAARTSDAVGRSVWAAVVVPGSLLLPAAVAISGPGHKTVEAAVDVR